MSLEELLELEVSAPSKGPRPMRAAPGVVTVITREELLRSGARDLIDVLRFVPGFDFGVDVQGAVSLGFRGNWGEEGKILVLVDGHEINEPLYLTTQFGNRFPIELIQRIEVVRGPGSVIHGRTAELAVIQITTRSPDDLDGIEADGYYGQMDDGLGRRRLSLYAGHVFESLGGLRVHASGLLGQGRRSDETYRDFFQNEYSLTDADLDPSWAALGAAWKGLSVHFALDRYVTTTRDAFDRSLADEVRTTFTGYFFDARWDLAITDRVTLTPRISYKHQTPWRVIDREIGEPTYYDKTAERLAGTLTASVQLIEPLHLLTGVEVFGDRAELNRTDTAGIGLQQLFAGETTSLLTTAAAFAELALDVEATSLHLGARYEHNSIFGGKFVPRIAVTRGFGPFHLKLLFSQAFKAPGHENLGLNPDLRPETTTTAEIAGDYRIGERVLLSLNLFDTTIDDPIIFTFEEKETYANFPRTGTRGVEAGARVKLDRAHLQLTYSFYSAEGKNEVPTYAIAGHDELLRGFAAHKVTLEGSIPLFDGLSLYTGAVLLGARYGALQADSEGNSVTGREPVTLLAHAYLAYDCLLVPGLTVGAGIYNLLDEDDRFLQPHDSGHAPLPGPSREYVFHLGYTSPFP